MYINPVKAQVNGNYVPNPNFTNYSFCPIRVTNPSIANGTNLSILFNANQGYKDILPEWRDVGEAKLGGASVGSLYFNACNNDACGVDIGTNYFGFQNDRTNNTNGGYLLLNGSTGYNIPIVPTPTGGASLIVPQAGQNRSYITTQLPIALQAGKTYEVSFYISLAERSTLAVSNFGAVFTNSRFPIGNTGRNSPIIDLGNLTQNNDYFLNSNIITDRVNWVKISGSVTATNNYNWITIGVFNNSSADSLQVPDYILLPPATSCIPPPTAQNAYNGYGGFAYYLDEVGVYERPDPAFTYNVTGAICDLVNFNVTATYDQPWYNHTWKVLGGTSIIPTLTGATANFTNIPAGTYTLVHEVTGYGATYTSQQTITITGYNHTTYTANTGFEIWTAQNNPLNNGSGSTGKIEDLLLIPSGSHIKVDNMEILFGSNAKLIIERGASLIANNTIFNVNEECQAIMWDGIQVHGNSTKPQGISPNDPSQGYLELRTCTLKNAYTGVLASKPGSKCYGGAVFKIVNSTFVNNAVHVKVKYYNASSNKSYVLRSNFKTTDFLRDGSGIAVKNYVELESVGRFSIRSSTFETDNLNFVGIVYPQRGNGIVSTNSGLTLQPNNTFINLNTAIRLIRTGVSNTKCFFEDETQRSSSQVAFLPSSYINANNMIGCYRGIWASNTMGDYYAGNDINISGKLNPTDPDESIGIFSEACSPIFISNNQLYTDNPDSYGMLVRNNGTFGSIVEGNTLNNTAIALQHDLNNKIATINCNQFSGSSFQDWLVNPDRQNQPLTGGVFFPSKVGDCFKNGLSENQFLTACSTPSEKQIKSYVEFDYAVGFVSIPNNPDQNCVSRAVIINRCGIGESSPVCEVITDDPIVIDNTLRNTSNPQVRNYLISKLLSIYLSDTLSESLLFAADLINAEQTLEAKKLKVQALLFANDITELRNTLDSIVATDDEEDKFLAFNYELLGWLENGYAIDSLWDFVPTLEFWASQNYIVSDLAKSILEVYYEQNFHHNPIMLNNGGNRIAQSVNKKEIASLYPNPADNRFTVKSAFKAGDKLSVYSNLGSKVAVFELKADATEYEFNTEALKAGIYSLVIQKQNGELENYKFSIIH